MHFQEYIKRAHYHGLFLLILTLFGCGKKNEKQISLHHQHSCEELHASIPETDHLVKLALLDIPLPVCAHVVYCHVADDPKAQAHVCVLTMKGEINSVVEMLQNNMDYAGWCVRAKFPADVEHIIWFEKPQKQCTIIVSKAESYPSDQLDHLDIKIAIIHRSNIFNQGFPVVSLEE